MWKGWEINEFLICVLESMTNTLSSQVVAKTIASLKGLGLCFACFHSQ